MALKDYLIRKETIPFPGGDFDIYPIGLADIFIMLQANGRMEELKTIYDLAEQAGLTKSIDTVKITQFLLKHAAQFFAELIAHAAREPTMVDHVRALPLSSQIDALNKLLTLAFEAEGGVKKFGESVVALLAQANAAMSEVNSIQSKASSPAFIGNAQS